MNLTSLMGPEAQPGAVEALALWAGLLILWMVVLSVSVVTQRRKLRVSLGDGGHDALAMAGRAFGNATEYIPAGLIALLLLALLGATPVLIHALGATLMIGRLAHGAGLLFQKGPSMGRLLGMALTYAVLLFAAGLLVGRALG